MTALSRIEAAGFSVTLKANGNLGIIPADKLTETQLAYLRSHKTQIIAELKAAQPAQGEYLPAEALQAAQATRHRQVIDDGECPPFVADHRSSFTEVADADYTEATLTHNERQQITRWVRSLGGSEAEILEETAAVIEQCADPDAKAFFLDYSKGIKPHNTLTRAADACDTRVYCHQCQHHRPIKDRIQIIHCARQNRRWLDDMPRNCDDFEPKLDTGN
jgi:hypothetical protein